MSNLGLPFDKWTVVVTAFTGAAAIEINGNTTCSAAGLRRKTKKSIDELAEKWRFTIFLIVDELSFFSTDDFKKLFKNCMIFKNNNYPFGGLPVGFSGDFSQLQPINNIPLYLNEKLSEFHECVNCFLELNIQHRFDNDKQWNDTLKQFREIGPSGKDIKLINSRVLGMVGGPEESDIP